LSLYAEKDSERGRIIVRISTDVGDPAQLLSQLFPEKSSEYLKTESSSP
jgi:ArsR family metal-binding transcriptional regulator